MPICKWTDRTLKGTGALAGDLNPHLPGLQFQGKAPVACRTKLGPPYLSLPGVPSLEEGVKSSWGWLEAHGLGVDSSGSILAQTPKVLWETGKASKLWFFIRDGILIVSTSCSGVFMGIKHQ